MIFRKVLLFLTMLGFVAIAAQSQAQPIITGITRSGVDPTNANTLYWNVTFDQPVTGVSTANFTTPLVGVTGILDSVTSAPGNQTWLVSVATVAGDGTIGLDLSNPAGINSMSGPLTQTAIGQIYNVDNTKPQVLSINRLDPNPTSASSVNFEITFSEPIYGLTSANLAPGGSLTGTVNSVVPSGSQTVWTANISVISGTGTIGLDLTDISNITDEAGNYLLSDYTAGQRYDIDQAGPALVCITRLDANPTSSTTVQFLVEFDEPTSNVQTTNFTISAGGVSGTITNVVPSGNGTTWTLTVDSIAGQGQLTVNLSNPSGIVDTFGNPMITGGPGCENYDVDRVSPEVTSITLPDTSPTSSTSLTFIVTFSEPVTSATLSDFALITNGSATGTISSVSTTGNITSVTVTGISGAGSLCLEVSSPSTITDLIGNPLINIPYSSACYIVCIEHGDVLIPRPADGETTVTTADNLLWDAPDPNLKYIVYFDGTLIGQTTDTLFPIPQPLTPGQHSYLIDIDGNCTSGTEIYFNVLDSPILEFPTKDYESCRSPRMFSWSAVDGASSYTLIIDGSEVLTTNDTVAVTTTTLSDGPHTWQVIANSEFGEQPSAIGNFTVRPDDPLAPTLFQTNGTIYSMLEGPGNTIYIAGDFTQVKDGGGNLYSRTNLAAYDKTSLTPLPWAPQINGAVRTMAKSATALYIGGDFTSVSGEPLTRIAALSLNTSSTTPTDFKAHANDTVRAIEIVGTTVYYGGDFTKVGTRLYNFGTLDSVPAMHIARADESTTEPAGVFAVGIGTNASVRDLLYDGTHMYISGVFSQIGNQPIHGLARATIDTNKNLTLDNTFDQQIDLYVYTMRKLNNRLYIGGTFSQIKGQQRFNAAAINVGDLSTSPSLLRWAPRVNASVESIDTQGPLHQIFLAGTFTNIALERNAYLAGVDPILGNVSTCSFNADRIVYSVVVTPKGALQPTAIFAGGAATGTGTLAP